MASDMSSLARRIAAAVTALCFATAGAQGPMASKADVAMVKKSLAEGRVTVLQITSRDKACGCRFEEEQAFDKLTGSYGRDVVFRRVEWSSCLTAGGPVCRTGIPVIYVYYGQGIAGVVTNGVESRQPESFQSLERIIERAKEGPPPLVQTPRRLIDDVGEPSGPNPSPAEREGLVFNLMSGNLDRAANICGNFNPHLSASIQVKIAAWRTRNKTKLKPRDQLEQVGQRIREVEMIRIKFDADRLLFERLSINRATRAGCQELSRLIDKL